MLVASFSFLWWKAWRGYCCIRLAWKRLWSIFIDGLGVEEHEEGSSFISVVFDGFAEAHEEASVALSDSIQLLLLTYVLGPLFFSKHLVAILSSFPGQELP